MSNKAITWAIVLAVLVAPVLVILVMMNVAAYGSQEMYDGMMRIFE